MLHFPRHKQYHTSLGYFNVFGVNTNIDYVVCPNCITENDALPQFCSEDNLKRLHRLVKEHSIFYLEPHVPKISKQAIAKSRSVVKITYVIVCIEYRDSNILFCWIEIKDDGLSQFWARSIIFPVRLTRSGKTFEQGGQRDHERPRGHGLSIGRSRGAGSTLEKGKGFWHLSEKWFSTAHWKLGKSCGLWLTIRDQSGDNSSIPRARVSLSSCIIIQIRFQILYMQRNAMRMLTRRESHLLPMYPSEGTEDRVTDIASLGRKVPYRLAAVAAMASRNGNA